MATMSDEEREQEIRRWRLLMNDPGDIGFLIASLDAARAERDAANARADMLEKALEFYADPATYHAISLIGDPPCGEFWDDFDEDPKGKYGSDRPTPGKRARAALAPSKGGG